MTIDWVQAALLCPFDDACCQLVALSHFIDVRTTNIARMSPAIQVIVPSPEIYRDVNEQASCVLDNYEASYKDGDNV